MKLYSYFRSTAAYRVRIALNYKGLDHDIIPVHLLRDGGQQNSAEYLNTNPSGLVPSLQTEASTLHQSVAILEYLEERYPDKPILPKDPVARADIRGMALNIACDIHPLNNLRVLQYLRGTLKLSDSDKNNWYQHWIAQGFKAIEIRLAHTSNGQYCFGETPTMADFCLIPQVYNAQRFQCPMQDFPTINMINDHCLLSTAFNAASPDQQADAE